VLDVEPSTDHSLQFKEGVVGLDRIIWEAVDEFNAILLDLVALLLGGTFQDLLVEFVGGDGDVEGIILELLARPLVVRSQEKNAEFGVFLCLSFDEIKGLICSFAVENVVKTSVMNLLGFPDFLEKVGRVDGVDEFIQVHKEDVLVGNKRLGKSGFSRLCGKADDVLLDLGGVTDTTEARRASLECDG
jgi:hypothetical protein